MPSCIVCEEPCAKLYRCRRCTKPYCSIACYKDHQLNGERLGVCVAPVEPTPALSSYDEAVARADATVATGASPPCATEEPSGELTVLQSAHLVALANNPTIRNQLKTAELRKLLRIIDNSRSRLDALDAALHNVPEFREFCSDVLATISEVQSSTLMR